MFFPTLALVQPGDEVIYPDPGFPIYESMVGFVGGVKRPIRLREEREFRMDVAELAELVTDRTRLIILNSPHNPTGSVLTRADLEAAQNLPKSDLDDPWLAELREGRGGDNALLTSANQARLAGDFARAASLYGERSWRSGQGEPAAFGFELARRLQPRDWRYHWYAGQFWFAQAAYGGKKEAANLADHAFAAAIRANAADPRPLLGRLATQLRFAPLLGDRQPTQVLRDWADRALALAPLDSSVRRDHAAALAQLGTAQ